MLSRITYFKTTQKVIMGLGSIDKVNEEIKERNLKNVFIVTDEGLIKSGIYDILINKIKKNAKKIDVFSDVPPDPPIETVYKCFDHAKGKKIDLIIGLGGGSALDIAKMLSIMFTNNDKIENFFGINLIKKRGVTKFLIPTTAGTGSEVTPIAILSDESEHLKKGVVSDYLLPDVAILDGELTRTLPPIPTASSGMDALIHAVEAFTSVNANDYTDYLAIKAMSLISNNLRMAWTNGDNLEARQKMLEGSFLAGQAFANAGVTAVHAFAYPLGGEFHIPHGIANTVMLCPVLEFNMISNLEKFSKIADVVCPYGNYRDLKEKSLSAINFMRDLAIDLRLPVTLKELKVPYESLGKLAEGVMKVTRLLANNPRKLSYQDAVSIYKKAYGE
ncbi:MAG: iron-containing alcohol dehydrogenase [Thermodesulfovibrionales bacterium]|nr:iron-containing alcohol dehydrogenase [Thermodesulfovibrionales bacterium]